MREDGPLTLPSLGNFRDIGGLPTASGAYTRMGRLYRSPRLTGLSHADIESLETRAIEAIVDFRGAQEAASAPIALSPTLMQRRVSLPIEPQAGARIRLAEADGIVSHEAAQAIMMDSYRTYVTDHAPTYARFVRLVAAAEGPVVFHCSAGKDRTGFAAALLLAAVGVRWEAVVTDYLRTNADWQPPADIADRVPESYRRALLGVDACYLDAAFETLEREWGGAEPFVRTALGDDDRAFARFQRALTEG